MPHLNKFLEVFSRNFFASTNVFINFSNRRLFEAIGHHRTSIHETSIIVSSEGFLGDFGFFMFWVISLNKVCPGHWPAVIVLIAIGGPDSANLLENCREPFVASD